jgi:hypothetical protein
MKTIDPRPGTNWTSKPLSPVQPVPRIIKPLCPAGWIMFAVSGVMQGTLLIICITWKYRQRRLSIDDFGRPLGVETSPYGSTNDQTQLATVMDSEPVDGMMHAHADSEETPLLAQHKARGRSFGRMSGETVGRIGKFLRGSNPRKDNGGVL